MMLKYLSISAISSIASIVLGASFLIMEAAHATENVPLPGSPVNCVTGLVREYLHSDLETYARTDFELFTVARQAGSHQEWWKSVLEAITQRNDGRLSELYAHVPDDEVDRAARLLATAADRGFKIPPSLGNELTEARQQRSQLRAKTLTIQGTLSDNQRRDLTNQLTMIGIRRSKVERVYLRAKKTLGLSSEEYTPIIRSDMGQTALSDEARIFINRYNAAIAQPGADVRRAYEGLANGLYDLYLLRVYEPIQERYFTVNGISRSLSDFINMDAYRQVEQRPENTFMHAGTLRPENVQQPEYRNIKATREVWWNRGRSVIRPNGSIRIARNVKVLPDGSQHLVSVELIYQSKADKYFLPYRFEPGPDGSLRQIDGLKARKTMLTCYACHRRLYGIIGGGITPPNHPHVPSIDWKINGWDFTKRKYHSDPKGLVSDQDGK